MGQVESLKRQGLRLTGRLAEVELATQRAVQSLDLGSRFYGAAIYAEDTKRPAELAVIHQTSENTSPDHLEFVAQNLTRKRIPKETTSVGTALKTDKSGIYASQMAAHDCINIVAKTPESRFVLQLAFDKGAAPNIGEPEKLLHLYGHELSVFQSVSNLLRDYRDDLSVKMDLDPPQSPNGVLMFSDISGYTDIIATEGQAVAYGITDRLRNTIMAIADKYGGKVIREEGDGIWTGFSKLDERALEAAKDIKAAYRDQRSRDPSKTVKKSRIRTAIATGYMEPALDGDIFSPSIKYNSLAFLSARLMSESSPRGRDFIALSPGAADVLDGFDPDKLKARKVKSTFAPRMFEI